MTLQRAISKIRNARIVAAAVEAQFVGPSRNVAMRLACAEGLWEGACYAVGCPVQIWTPQPSEWRRALGIKCAPRRAAKEAAIGIAFDIGQWETADVDVADAIAIAIAAQ